MRKSTERKSRKRRKPGGQRSKANIIEFPGLEIQPTGEIEVTPLQLLGIMLKCVLKHRITDEEVDTICSTYYKTVKDWWG